MRALPRFFSAPTQAPAAAAESDINKDCKSLSFVCFLIPWPRVLGSRAGASAGSSALGLFSTASARKQLLGFPEVLPRRLRVLPRRARSCLFPSRARYTAWTPWAGSANRWGILRPGLCGRPGGSGSLCARKSLSLPVEMLRLACWVVLLGHVAAGPDMATQASDGPQLHHRASQDVTLECRTRAPLDPDPHHLRVHWHLLRGPAGDSVVHSYHAGADQLGDQAEEFRGRTRLLLEGIREGVAALSLAGVRPSDSGTYRCFIMDGQGADSMDIVLRVAAPYEPPQLTVLSRAGGQLVLQCRSAGGYPQPEITWHDGNGTRLSQDEPVELQRSRQGAFEVWSSLSLTPRPGGSVCCALSHRPLQQNMSVCETLPGLQALEQRFPGWAMALVTLALVTLVCAVLIHWGLPLIPAEGLHLGWRRAPGSQDWHRVRTDPPEVEMAER
ncbi:butyrophilin subfamily 1 member A1-like isoform X2 [Trachemys scripta elegans]|uniref:butyrophilin subfamily 1 member A1-like isoform X2 n=1 Tax=Trachemys scripta elegans TaxID=31138 RepID=UPI001554A21B|nr:butyrophilin subfamily 1 member A1-like isoform X2 [Trachemys scripta elegans]